MVVGNDYTRLGMSDVKKMHAEIVAKLAARKGAIRDDIAKHIDNDAVCMKFADGCHRLSSELAGAITVFAKSLVSCAALQD